MQQTPTINTLVSIELLNSRWPVSLFRSQREKAIEVLLGPDLIPIAKVIGREEPGAPLEPIEEGDLAGVVPVVRLCGEFFAQQVALAHEVFPRRGKAREIDVLDETPIVGARRYLMASRQDQTADAAAEHRTGPGRIGEKQPGAAPLVVRVARLVHGIVKPQRHFYGIPIAKQCGDFVKPMQAIVDMMQVVKAPIRPAEASAQIGLHLVGRDAIRRRYAAPPQPVEPCTGDLAGVHRAPYMHRIEITEAAVFEFAKVDSRCSSIIAHNAARGIPA